MNKRSDNFYAEQILKMVGAKKFGIGDWQSGLKAIRDFLKTSGIRGPYHIADGSGLSRYNLVTPRLIVRLLRKMFYNKLFVDSLPISGVDKGYGSLSNRIRNADLAGKVIAKTGSLENVSNISGYALNSEATLAFSILMNSLIGNIKQTYDFQSKFAEIIVRVPLCLIPKLLAEICKQG
jgi:D-alanyl-D-alanine carboxypeptidase/D-alanyl-D-alanine-endopeptidase (penicillin-binding protein 4)